MGYSSEGLAPTEASSRGDGVGQTCEPLQTAFSSGFLQERQREANHDAEWYQTYLIRLNYSSFSCSSYPQSQRSLTNDKTNERSAMTSHRSTNLFHSS